MVGVARCIGFKLDGYVLTAYLFCMGETADSEGRGIPFRNDVVVNKIVIAIQCHQIRLCIPDGILRVAVQFNFAEASLFAFCFGRHDFEPLDLLFLEGDDCWGAVFAKRAKLNFGTVAEREITG